MAGGRPTKYREEFVEQARQLVHLGATDANLAAFFKVSVVTLNAWKLKYPEFLKSLQVTKEEADRLVEQSLYKRAMGYTHEETDLRVIKGKLVATPTLKHYPPDSTALIFWLKNRQPNRWRDKVDMVHEGGDTPIKSITEIRLVGVKPDGNPTT